MPRLQAALHLEPGEARARYVDRHPGAIDLGKPGLVILLAPEAGHARELPAREAEGIRAGNGFAPHGIALLDQLVNTKLD